ncbi:MAG: hypothetical protein N3J91_05895 [Verrucomicrobiae bacterium]|nr:hypothetical protein [Verrucomicrobiae bacterium]
MNYSEQDRKDAEAVAAAMYEVNRLGWKRLYDEFLKGAELVSNGELKKLRAAQAQYDALQAKKEVPFSSSKARDELVRQLKQSILDGTPPPFVYDAETLSEQHRVQQSAIYEMQAEVTRSVWDLMLAVVERVEAHLAKLLEKEQQANPLEASPVRVVLLQKMLESVRYQQKCRPGVAYSPRHFLRYYLTI